MPNRLSEAPRHHHWRDAVLSRQATAPLPVLHDPLSALRHSETKASFFYRVLLENGLGAAHDEHNHGIETERCVVCRVVPRSLCVAHCTVALRLARYACIASWRRAGRSRRGQSHLITQRPRSTASLTQHDARREAVEDARVQTESTNRIHFSALATLIIMGSHAVAAANKPPPPPSSDGHHEEPQMTPPRSPTPDPEPEPSPEPSVRADCPVDPYDALPDRVPPPPLVMVKLVLAPVRSFPSHALALTTASGRGTLSGALLVVRR